MNKTWIVFIVIGVVLVIVLFSVLTSTPADADDMAKIQEILNDPKTAAKNCKYTCTTLTKKYSILARIRPKRICMSDCALGKDVTKVLY